MTARIQITKALMNILEELVTANTYISTHSIPVVQWTEAGTDIGQRFALVQASQTQRLFANSNCYSVDAVVHAMTYMGDDQSRTSNNALFEELSALMIGLTPATCNATTAHSGSGLTIDGIINHIQSDSIEDNYWQQSIQATFFMQVATTT